MNPHHREEMKKVYTTSILLLTIAIALAGCKKASTSTNSNAKLAQANSSNSNSMNGQPSANDNRPASEGSGNVTASDTNNPAPKLSGTYAMTEVHAGGVVTMISQAKTEITFTTDGSYTRISKRNNNIYHSDAGQYRLEGNDQIVLIIKIGKGKVYNPPLERKHAFTLSRDGEELKMSSDEGKVAIFRKVKKA